MKFSLCRRKANTSPKESIFKIDYRRQLYAALIVSIISISYGIGAGWLSPMLVKLQSSDESPLGFSLDVHEVSWLGSVVSVGGIIGNIGFGLLMDCIGRKLCLYLLVFPHLCLWLLLYLAKNAMYLYAARTCGGIAGGGIFVLMPIFLAEISHPLIRGRLTSLFTITANIGMLFGYILSSHIDYHIIPWLVMPLPLIFVMLIYHIPDTPQHLLRKGRPDLAEYALKYYSNFEQIDDLQKADNFKLQFADMRDAIEEQQATKGAWKDFLNKNSLKAMGTGIVLIFINMFSGTFALLNYMSSIFEATKTKLDPDTNTIIIGLIQVIGTYAAITVVDDYGRKFLLLISTGGMAIGMALFGTYAFFAQETELDLSAFSAWLPLLLMAFIIFIANVGIISITFVVLIEIMPAKIRSKASTVCLALLSVFCFTILKVFPIFMEALGVSSVMWFCASVCTFGLLYFSLFIKETKGKSMYRDN